MRTRDLLLRELADGRFHSGQDLASSMGLSRAAVWKQVRRLESDFGLTVYAVRGRGYRLLEPLELLDAQRIVTELGPASRTCLESMNLLSSVPSTNFCATEDLPAHSGCARAWLAEHQTLGRGRRGRPWISAFGQNICLSLAWRFDLPMSDLGGFSLAAGVAVAEGLSRLGVEGHVLKWPNDILLDGRKLSGILVEVAGESEGPASAVVGVGANVHMSAAQGADIDQPWIDLNRAGLAMISRNRIAGVLIDHLINACRLFSNEGFAPFAPRWQRFDRLIGEPVRLSRGAHISEGVYRGITLRGTMLLEDLHGCTEHSAGEVSLRRRE